MSAAHLVAISFFFFFRKQKQLTRNENNEGGMVADFLSLKNLKIIAVVFFFSAQIN
jgi:hypothetical protein